MEKPKRRWEDNIKMDLGEVGRGHEMDRRGSGYVQVAGFCECGNEPPVSTKFGEIWTS